MAFSRAQRSIAWTSLSLMAAMVVFPPWIVHGEHPTYGWIWSPPMADVGRQGGLMVHWRLLRDELFVVALGMLLLLFLRERHERRHPPAHVAEDLAAIF
jgi:hypothetical protein